METIIRVRKADGEIKEVRRAGHITDAAVRASIEASACAKGAEVVQWLLIGAAARTRAMSASARQRFERYNASPRRRCNDCEGPCDGSHPLA